MRTYNLGREGVGGKEVAKGISLGQKGSELPKKN